MSEPRPLELLLELSEFGYVLHTAIADRVGEDLAANIPVMILGHLAAEGPLRPTALMSRTGLTSGGMTKAVDRLVLAELVVRFADASDGRAVLVGLSPRGRDTVRRIDEALREALDENADVVQRITGGLEGARLRPRQH